MWFMNLFGGNAMTRRKNAIIEATSSKKELEKEASAYAEVLKETLETSGAQQIVKTIAELFTPKKGN